MVLFWPEISALGVWVSWSALQPASPGACENVTSDLGLGDGFAGYSGFLHQLQLASHDLAAMWQKY